MIKRPTWPLFFSHFLGLENIIFMIKKKQGVKVMIKTSDLKQREVINIVDGKRLGFVTDLDIDLEQAKIRAIIVPAQTRVLGLFSRGGDYVIPWEQIRKIGSDVILVELKEFLPPNTNG